MPVVGGPVLPGAQRAREVVAAEVEQRVHRPRGVSPVIVDSTRTWATRSAVPLPASRASSSRVDAVGVDRARRSGYSLEEPADGVVRDDAPQVGRRGVTSRR